MENLLCSVLAVFALGENINTGLCASPAKAFSTFNQDRLHEYVTNRKTEDIVNFRGFLDRNIVHFAIVNPDPKSAVMTAVSIGADIDQASSEGRTPLIDTAEQNWHQSTRILLDLGANPDLPEGKGPGSAREICETVIRRKLMKDFDSCQMIVDHTV